MARRRLDMRFSSDLIDTIDFAATKLSLTRTDYMREAVVTRLRRDGIDPLKPRRYRRRRSSVSSQQEAAP
jgi:hypothetical protein